MCERLFPGSDCGLYGSCINSTCVCKEGWFQTISFAMFRKDRFTINQNVLVCDLNPPIIQTLHAIAGIFCLMVVVLQFFFIKKWSQLVRLSFLISGFFFHGIYAFTKVADPFRAFGEDTLLTWSLSLGFLLTNISSIVFLNKYIWYQEHCMPVHVAETKKLIKRVANMERTAILCSLIGPILSAVTIYREDVRAMIVVGFLSFSFISIFVLIPGAYMIDRLIADIRVVQMPTETDKKERLKTRFKEAERNLLRVKHASMALHVVVFTAFFFGAFWNGLMKFLNYLVPVMLILGSSHSLIVLYSYQETRTKRIKQKEKDNAKKKKASGDYSNTLELSQISDSSHVSNSRFIVEGAKNHPRLNGKNSSTLFTASLEGADVKEHLYVTSPALLNDYDLSSEEERMKN